LNKESQPPPEDEDSFESRWESAKLYLLLSVFPLIGLLIAALGYANYLKAEAFLEHALRAQSEVIASGTRDYKPLFRYIDQHGQEQFAYISANNGGSYFEKGDTATVLYSADGEHDIEVDTFSSKYGDSLPVCMFGGVFTAIGMLFMMVMRAEFFLTRYRRIFWRRIETQLTAIEVDWKTQSGERHPIRFVSTARHPETKRMRTYKSKYLWLDREKYSGLSSLTVYVKPGSSKKYYVEIPAPPKQARS